jgi:ribose transport system permease protein
MTDAPYARAGSPGSVAAATTERPVQSAPASESRWQSTVARAAELGIIVAFVVLVAVALLAVPRFGAADNIRSILSESAFLGLVAVGMTFVVISGNYIDLSVVAQVATAGILVTVLESHGIALAIAVAVIANLGFAAANGLGIGVMRANGVIVTLAVETAGLGLLTFLTNGAQYTGSSSALAALGTGSFGPVPYVFLILIAVGALGQLLLTRTNAGLLVRSVGSSRAAAQAAGVRVGRAVLVAFALSSICCAIAGILLAGYNNSALPSVGQGYDFNSLAAVIIGGTSLFGGRGSVLRSVVGVLFLETLLNILVLAGLSFDWQQLVEGLIIVAAVSADTLLRRRGLL